MQCSACSSTALVGGTVVESSGGGTAGFKPDEVGMLKSILGMGIRDIRAYGCVHCGNLQLAVEFTDKDRKRYQQFEGQQPGVIERINSESGETD